MSAEPESCGLTPVSLRDDPDTGVEVRESSGDFNMDLQKPIFFSLDVHQHETQSAKVVSRLSRKAAATSVVTTSDSESGKFSGESELCMEHESDLDWFCSSEQKRICLHCTIVGPCQSHIVTPLVSRVTGVRVSAQTFPEIILSRCSLFVETVGSSGLFLESRLSDLKITGVTIWPRIFPSSQLFCKWQHDRLYDLQFWIGWPFKVRASFFSEFPFVLNALKLEIPKFPVVLKHSNMHMTDYTVAHSLHVRNSDRTAWSFWFGKYQNKPLGSSMQIIYLHFSSEVPSFQLDFNVALERFIK